jgi:hypothetical protein
VRVSAKTKFDNAAYVAGRSPYYKPQKSKQKQGSKRISKLPQDKANFVRFNISVPRENLDSRMLQRAIQTRFGKSNELNQFKVHVSQKVGTDTNADGDSVTENLDSPWLPTCGDLTGDMETHRTDGNCLCYALYEAYDKQETLVQAKEEAITVRNLRRHIAKAQVSELRRRCENIPEEIKNLLEAQREKVRNAIGRILNPDVQTQQDENAQKRLQINVEIFDRAALFSDLNGSNENIQRAVEYIIEKNISNRDEISDTHLLEILVRLGMPRDSQFITNDLNQEPGVNFIELKALYVVNPQTGEDLLTTLCDSLILMAGSLHFKGQRKINCDRLLNSAQRILRLSLSKTTETDILKTYNHNLPEQEHMVLKEGLPSLKVNPLIELAIETIKTNMGSYIHNDCLHHVVRMLQRPILLIYENCELRNGRMVNGNERGKVCDCMLHALDGQTYAYSVDIDGKPCPNENTPQFSEFFTDVTITIAMHPGHYYGQLSFTEQHLHVGNRLVIGVNKDGLIFQQNAIPTAPAREMRLQRRTSSRVSKKTTTIELKVENDVKFNFKIATRTVQGHDSSGSELYEYVANISISKEAFQNINLANRKSGNVNHEVIGYYKKQNNKGNISENEEEESTEATLPRLVDFRKLLETIQDDQVKAKLESTLKNFVIKFLPDLQKLGKHKQLITELENLEHIRACIDEMLDPNGLNFKSDFVAKVVIYRLQIAMFGFGEEGTIKVGDQGEYQPGCMFDFGDEWTSPQLIGSKYKEDGILSSPNIRANRQKNTQKHDGSKFSFIRGTYVGKEYKDRYTMRDGKVTPCLPNRFRQYLAHITKSNEIASIPKKQAIAELPPAMMFLVGLQFGQNNIGTWNPFTLAAKRYFALQSQSHDNLFWQPETEPDWRAEEDILSNAFKPLLKALTLEKNIEFDEEIFQQFEKALCSYYAMTMEILSRVQFDENDRSNSCMQEIFRLEGLEALENIGLIHQNDDSWEARNYIEANAPRSIIVSSSASMFVTSLDKPKDFPPPIKVITRYDKVHHARVFGTHFFNVDLEDADRMWPGCFKKSNTASRTTYEGGCPFFKDRQREFLIMPGGLQAQVVGILPWAPHKDEYYVWMGASEKMQEVPGIEKIDLKEVEAVSYVDENLKHIHEQLVDMLKDMLKESEDQITAQAYVEAFKEVTKDNLSSDNIQTPKNILQIKFTDLSDAEIQQMLAIFNKQSNPDAQGIVKKYVRQLKAIKDLCKFNVLYGRNTK